MLAASHPPASPSTPAATHASNRLTSWQTPTRQDTPRQQSPSTLGPPALSLAQPSTFKEVMQPATGMCYAARRPMCTHMMMRRLYGANTCCLCGKVPPMGWLYSCHQDAELRRIYAALPSERPSSPLIEGENDCFQTMARLANSLNLSPSVVEGIQAGHYTFEQVDMLIAQKEHLNATIRKAQNPALQGVVPTLNAVLKSHEPGTEAGLGTLGSPSRPIASANTSCDPSPQQQQHQNEGCGFRVCQTCRPQFHERATMSLDSVLRDEVPAVTQEEISHLRVLDAKIISKLDLGRTRPSSSLNNGTISRVLSRLSGSLVDDSSDWAASSASASNSSSYQEDVFPTSNPGGGLIPRPNTSHRTPEHPPGSKQRAKPYEIFDTPCRASSTASTVSLPTPSTTKFEPITPPKHEIARKAAAASNQTAIVGGVTLYRRIASYRCGAYEDGSHSSLGSGVEVEGDVALTEEAIRTGTPDILTST